MSSPTTPGHQTTTEQLRRRERTHTAILRGPQGICGIIRLIGRGNLLAISGGRHYPYGEGVELPVGCGYRVRVVPDGDGFYAVSRLFKRGGREFLHGVRERVPPGEVGEAAYCAACFRCYGAAEWPTVRGVKPPTDESFWEGVERAKISPEFSLAQMVPVK
jgi:hypothetical protein